MTEPTHSRKTKVRPIRFTDTRVRDDTKDAGEYADDRWPYLRLYVTDAGAKTWGLYKWSPAKGYAVRRALGSWPQLKFEDAKKMANEKADALDRGEDIAKPKARPGAGPGTIKYILDRYTKKIKRDGKRDYGWAEDIFTRDDSKAPTFKDWLEKPLSSITRDMLEERHEAITKQRGKAAATRALKAFRALYAYAEKHEGYEGKNIGKFIETKESPPRQRVLTNDEKARFLAALDDPSFHDTYVPPFFHLLLLTGVRWGNLCSANWGEIDLDQKVWVIPADKSKAGHELRVGLRKRAIELLKAQRKKHPDSPWVFPSPKNSSSGHLVEPSFAFKRVLALAKIDAHTTPHDLRRTFGSTLIRAGESLPTVAAALGHRNPNTTARHYAWMDDESIQAALNRVPV